MSTKKSNFLSLTKKNSFLKKLFFFYNIYFRNYKFYFDGSQFGEEKKILNLFDKNFKGSYVDLGCFHPTRSNNTFQMYKKGWHGLNVDLNPLTIELFNFARPSDVNVCSAISNKNQNKKLYYLGDFDSKNTLDINHKIWLSKHFNISKNDFKIKNIKTVTLAQILRKHEFYKIDFMNIDLEGHELEVLKSINFKEFDIKVLCVEVLNHYESAKKRKKQIISLLKKNSYKLVDKSNINFIFKKNC